ncbi:MAG: pyridoxamine 5'-phosphate oxidase family protein, partial [Tepidisphaeraceae bacterium]
MTAILTDDMRAVVQAAHLCFAATITPDRCPNLSPKGTIRVWDDRHLFFLDIVSPTTRANLQHSPWIELNVVDQLSRRGYRFLGQAELHVDDAIYAEATRRVFAEEGHSYTVAAVVLSAVERALPLLSPGYMHVPDEAAMRDTWRVRRRELDDEFEQYLRKSVASNPRASAVPLFEESTMIARPQPSEHIPYFSRYIDLVPDGDLLALLETQHRATQAMLAPLTPEQAKHRYADGKWSVTEVIGHLADTERIFAYRALRFARNDATVLPGFDENLYVPTGRFDERPLGDVAAEFGAVRSAT